MLYFALLERKHPIVVYFLGQFLFGKNLHGQQVSFLVYGGKKKNLLLLYIAHRFLEARVALLLLTLSSERRVSCSSVASLCEGRTSDFVLSAVEVEHRVL